MDVEFDGGGRLLARFGAERLLGSLPPDLPLWVPHGSMAATGHRAPDGRLPLLLPEAAAAARSVGLSVPYVPRQPRERCRIAFDLDQTLVAVVFDEPGLPGVDPFPGGGRQYRLAALRPGVQDLVRRLQARGHEVLVYTGATRAYARWWLERLGLGQLEVLAREDAASGPDGKDPGAYGIDLLVDDGVGIGAAAATRALVAARLDPGGLAGPDNVPGRLANLQLL